MEKEKEGKSRSGTLRGVLPFLSLSILYNIMTPQVEPSKVSEYIADIALPVVPPITVTSMTLLGFPLKEWVYVATLVYTFVATVALVKKTFFNQAHPIEYFKAVLEHYSSNNNKEAHIGNKREE